MPQFKKYKLGELYDVSSGLSKPREEFGFGHPFVTFKDVFYNFFLPDKLSELANTTEKEINSCSVKKGDIFLTRTSETMNELGMSSVALKDYPKATFNGFTKRLRLKEDVDFEIDPVFIGYLFRTSEIRNQIDMHASMTTRASLNSTAINSIEISIPDIEYQIPIGNILKCLNDKIELNRRTNHTLEQIAQTLFKKYFVDDIDPEILPEGWSISSLDKIADYLNGIALQNFRPKDEIHYLPVIKIKEMKNGISSSTEKASVDIPKQYIIQDGDILFSWSGSLEVEIWCHGKGALNQHLFKVSSTEYPKWFYYFWTKEHLQDFKKTAASKATTMGHIQRHHLTEAEIYIPSKTILEKADKEIAPLLDNIILNRIEIRSLTQVRNLLLPKLMSGEVEVNSKEKELVN